MVMACRAVGGIPESVVPAAKALVLAGGAFDLHDDIVDGSYIRTEKCRKTTLGIFGKEVTLLIGDAFLIEGLCHLVDLRETLPRERVELVVETIKNGLYELGSAEIEELRLVRNLDVSPNDYLKIVRMKAADVESYTRIGGIIGGGSEEEIDALGEFGRLLGMIVILRDDIEDTFNDRFELASRITKESLPLPVIFALEDEAIRSKIRSFIENNRFESLKEIVDLVEKNKGFQKTKSTIEDYVSRSKELLAKVRDPRELLSLFNI
ncbi:MAG: class 1 isoprenoid biosynthesis enzyme [Candidatus Verstraetearchaeota archaeon]|nr:class 1 isoprenoid biosynthesis enzyme [Candidatus Verstraetearchaeota archaeon]